MADDEEYVGGEDAAPGDEYVVCSRCGARIKATRERCLRCFEPLHVDQSQLPVWRSQRISDQTGLLVGALAVAAVGALVYVLYTTADNSKADAEAKPAEHNALVGVTPPQSRGKDAGDAAQPDAAAAPGDVAAAPVVEVTPGVAAFTPSADDLAATRRSFEDKLKYNPNDIVALNGLGLALQGLGNLPEALATFKKAAEVAPRNGTARLNLAHLEAQLGQWDKAIADYRVAVSLEPDDYGGHYNLGLALQQTRDDQAAIEQFEAAVQLAPREAAAHRALGVSLERAGRGADAGREYQRYLELAPDSPDAASIRDRVQRLPKV